MNRTAAPPPLDLRFLTAVYVPTWDVLRRMRESERTFRVGATLRTVEAVLDMHDFGDSDDEYRCDDAEALKSVVECAFAAPLRTFTIAAAAAVFVLLVAAFRVQVPAAFRFVRKRV